MSDLIRDPTTHDYTRPAWGHATMLRTEDKGQTLTGHIFGHVREGDYLILNNGPGTTRYQVTTVRSIHDPDDMYYITAAFAPRKKQQEGTS